MSSSQYDLTGRMAPFFDVHMISPLLDFLRESKMYDAKSISKEKIKCIINTNMIEAVEDEYELFADDADMQAEYAAIKPEFEARKEKAFHRIDNEPEDVKKVVALFSDTDVVSGLISSASLTIENLQSSMGITHEMLVQYYKFAKFKYECGMYAEAEEMLGNFLSVVQPSGSAVLGALWGRLACRILHANWEESLTDLLAVKTAIESRAIPPIDQLHQRAWLLHWGLFVHFNQRDGTDAHADFFAEPVYLQTLENLCPWMLRYFTVAVIISHRRKTTLKDVLSEIKQMKYLYSDPITEFVESLYSEFDFDEAQRRLKTCQAIIENDFFLQIHAAKFMQQARLLICEVYCTIYRNVDLGVLADKLELSEDEAEKWTVDMVRNASVASTLDARIDSSGKQVKMSASVKPVYQDIVEATRDLTMRAGTLSSSLDTLLGEQGLYIKARGGKVMQ
jgi:translation initiation factor 3 subunit E